MTAPAPCARCSELGIVRLAGWWTLGGTPLCDDCADLPLSERLTAGERSSSRAAHPAGGTRETAKEGFSGGF